VPRCFQRTFEQDVTKIRNGKRETGNGKRETGNGKRETGVWELMYNGNPPKNSTWRTPVVDKAKENGTEV